MDHKEYPTPTDPPFSYNSNHFSNNPQITADESKISLIGSKISLNGSKISINGSQNTIDDPQITSNKPNISLNNPKIPSSDPKFTSTESQITFNELFKLLVYSKYTSLSRLKLVENVDDKKEFLILQGSNKTINNLKSRLTSSTLTSPRLLEGSTLTSSTLTSSTLVSEFTNFLEQLKRYDNYFKKTSEQCKCKLPTESTSISIDYNLFRRTIPQNDTENPKFDPIEYSALEKSLNLLKSRYEYDFSKLVSYQNIIYQIFLFDSHEFHLMAKYSPDIDPASQLRLNNTFPTLYYVYNEISKHRSEFLEKISFKRLSVSNSLDKQKFGSESQRLGLESQRLGLDQQKFGLDQQRLGLESQRLGSVGNTFDKLVTRLYETLMEHDIVLYIRIFKLNIVSVTDVESVILPVLREILDELQSHECDYHWISLFTESYTVAEDPKLDYIYKVLYLILDFSFNNKLFPLVDVTIDVIFSFSIRNPNFSNLLQCFSKYFKTIIYPILNTTGGKVVGGKVAGGISAELASGIPSSKVSTSDLSTTLTTTPMTSGILIPCLYNLESIVLFEYLSLQYPILSHKTDNSIIKEMSTLIPKIGNFIIRIDIEILDQITLDKLYKKDTFNFKLYIKNKRNFFLIFSHGNIFFSTQSNSNINPINDPLVQDDQDKDQDEDRDKDQERLVQDGDQDPDKLVQEDNCIQDRIKIFNKGSKYLCIEILFNECINIFINGKEFNIMKFEEDIEFYQVDFYYNIDNVNVKQFSTLTTGFRKFLIQSNVIEYPVTVLGQADSTKDSKVVPGIGKGTDGTSNTNSTEDSSKDINSKVSSKDIGTIGASTVTEGKGANSMGMKCTSEKNSNEIAVVTKTGESGTFVDTEGGEDIKGAVGPSTVTEGKGANSTLMECTMDNKADIINSIVDYIVYFSKGLSSIHMVISNINFNISLDNSFNPLNPKVFESLNILFELLLNIFESTRNISESLSNMNFPNLTTTDKIDSIDSRDSTDRNSIVMINLITIWRKLSESIISILSIIKIFFSLPINIEQIPLEFLNNLTKILYESIKYKSYYMDPEKVPETVPEKVPETVPEKVPETEDSKTKDSVDMEDPGTKVPKTKDPESKDPDSNYPDPKHSDSNYPDPKHSDSKFPDPKYPHSNYPDSTYLHFQNLHHPIDLISLANTVNLISLDILGSNQLISTQLFSYTSTQLLSEILMNIAYTSYFITDLTIFTKNNTLNFLNQSLCIEIFTKRTLTDVFIQNSKLVTGPSNVTRPTEQGNVTRPTEQGNVTRPTEQGNVTRPTEQGKVTSSNGPGKAKNITTDPNKTTKFTDPNKTTKFTDPNKTTKLTTDPNKSTKSTTNPTTPTTPTDPSITTKLITNPVEINLWWKLIYELLESDKLLLKNDILNDNCKCNLKLNELMLLDPMFNYCNYCLRKYFNYFSSIESLNYYTKLLSNENFYTIPRPSMLLCRFLLKHGITIILLNLYNKSNKSFTKSCNKSENGLDSDSESKSDTQSVVDSTGDPTVESIVDKLFEEYLIIFIPNNLKLIEEIFIYLLKLNEQILYIFGDLLKFDFRLLNFLNCLSILDLLTYFYEFIQSGTKYFHHIISCIKLLPYLIKVLLLYNKIFRILKYQKFNPINYLIYQFSSLLIIYMKFIQYIYTNDFNTHDFKLVGHNYRQVGDFKISTQVDQYISKQVEDELKDVNYIFKFPKCLVTNLNFNFNSSNGAWSNSTSNSNSTSSSNGTVDSSNIDSSKSMDSSNMDNCDTLDNINTLDNSKTLDNTMTLYNSKTLDMGMDVDMEIIDSIRKLLLLVQDFKYIKGTSISFRNISEIESFITNSHESEYRISNLTRGLLNMENWATKIFSDSFDQVHPRLIKLRYTLIALFIHLGSDCEVSGRLGSDNQVLVQLGSDKVSGHLRSDNERLEYHEAKKYSRIVCMKIFNKFQTMRCQNIKDKDLMKEMYLEDVISRCIWLIKNTPSHSNNGKLYGKNTMCVDTVSKMKTSTYHMMDYRTKLRSGTIFRRSNSSTNLNTNSYSSLKIDNTTKFDSRGVRDSRVVKSSRDSRDYRTYSTDYRNSDYNSSTVIRDFRTRDNRIFDDNFNELVEFILNGPTRLECEKRFLTHRLTSLIRISLLSSLKALIYSFLDLGYVHTHILKYNFSPLVVDLLVNPNLNTRNNPNTVGNNHNTFGNTNPNTVNNPNTGTNLTAVNSLNDILDLFWYIMINKLRPIMLSTYKDSNFELINGNKHVPDIYNRVVYDYLCSILENICDWYIRSGITTIDSTNYNRPNMNFWLGISLSFFSLVYSLGLEPMTDTRYSFQIFNYMMSILHPLPLSNFKKAMSNQTSLSCYTVEVALVIYFSEYFLVNFGETVENLFHCLKMRKFTRKDQLIVPGGTIYLMVKKSSKISETLKQDEPINLSFTHLWSFPKIENTSHGLGHLIYNFYVNFDQSNTTVMDSGNLDINTLNPIRNVSLEENDIIMWRMENYCYLISEVSLTKRTSNNIAMVINTSREITVYLTLPKNITNRITNEIELSLVNYLGGNLEIEGVNGTWTQVLGIKGLDYFYIVRSNLYLLLKYLLWVELSTNLHTANNNDTNSNKDTNSTNRVDVGKLGTNSIGKLCINRIDVGLVLGILFKYLRSTAIQIFNLSSACNCKDNPEKVSIKYHCSNISCQFKYSTTIKGYLVDSDNTADNLLVTRGCSTCSTNQIYKKELDFFWGNILSYLISLVRVCENYSLVYMVLNSLLTTFTLGERQAQAFLSMDSLGQKFCNLLVVTIKQLSATSNNGVNSGVNKGVNTGVNRGVNKGVNTGVNTGVKGGVNKFGVCDYGYMKTLLASPKIHALFVLKWLPPLKQVPLECIYATLRENFQSILISKSFKPVTKIEPNDPFVTLPHSDHFVTHRNSVDFEADISENTLQVIRANNMGGIVMYRIPTTLGTTAVQLTTNFYILNASRFGITVAPADCVFGTVSDLFERNDVVGFSHSNSLGFTSQLFAATIGYTIGDVLTAHFTLDHQEDGQLCLRTELLIGGNSIGSVLEVVFDPITQNDPSRRMSLVFIFQDPATLVLRGTSINPERNTSTNPGTLSESNIMSTFLTTNVRREIPTTNDRITSYNMNDRSNSYPNIRQINGELDRELDRELVNRDLDNRDQFNVGELDRDMDVGGGNEIIGSSNVEVVRALDRIVSRETSATARSRTVTEQSIPISDHTNSIEPFPVDTQSSSPRDLNEVTQNETTLNENVLTFNYKKYFNVEDSEVSFDNVPEWDVKFDSVESDVVEESPITLCKDEFWDKLLRDDKYTCLFAQFSDSVQVYQSVLSVNVPMFSGLKRELVMKIKSSFDDLYTLLSSNFKYTRLESTVRDCFSWLCVLCCDHDRQVWEKLSQKEFKVVSDFTLPFLLGSSFPSKTTLVTLPNELLLELFASISKILTVRLVITSLTLCATKKGSVRFIHGDVQTDSLIFVIASKSLLASTLILKVLSHRCFKHDLYSSTITNGISALNADFLHLLDGLTSFITQYLSSCEDFVISSNNIENVAFSNVESILQSLNINSTNISTQASYRTHNNALQSVELVLLVDIWNAIYSANISYEMIQELIKKTLGVKFMNLEFNVKMFGTCDKSFHTSSRIPSVRRHFMRRSHFYKLIEHDVFDMLQGLVHVFRDYFYRKVLDQCKDTMILFRSSIIHFSTTFDSNSLEYYELVDSNTGGNGVEKISKMNLFSAACDPLYSWQLLFYDPFKKEETGRNELVKVLFTEIIYCMVVSLSSIRYLKLLECVFWILDTLPKHPLCPCNLRLALTNKFTLSLLNFLFLNGTGSPPKLSQVSARITHKVIPSLSVWELEQLLELIMYLGTCAFMRVHSVCNYYSTSDLDMFTNFDHKRHDHNTRLTTANILHSFLTSFVLACEWIDNSSRLSDVAITRILEYSDFYNMGVYLYLARNKKLNKQMLSHLLSLTPEIYTSMPLRTGKLVKDSDKVGEIGDFGSFSTFSGKNFPSRKNSTMLKTSPILNQSDRNPQVHFISCSDRYHGLILKFKVEMPTRFVFSQYKDFSKVLAELIVSPHKTQELKLGQFYPLEEYVNNVPLIKYKLELDPKYIYTIGYTIESSEKININQFNGEKINDEQQFGEQPFNDDDIFKNEKMVYKLINGTCVEMYMTNNYIFWNIDSNTTSTYFKHQIDLIPFIIVNSRLDGEVTKCIIKLDSFVIIPVTNCYVKKHVNEFGLLNLGNGFVVRPAIRTGLSVHKTKVSFSGVTPLDLSTSALVKLNDKINLTLNPCLDEVMRYDPCLPFRLSFKFEKGFNINVRPDFYIGLVSDREKLLWFSNGDLYVSTNFHVPSKDNEYRKINCLPYYETDVISVSFNPQESSLYFTVTNQTVKLDFHSYYYHITSVYTDNIIASTNTNTTEDIGTNTRALSTNNTTTLSTHKSSLSADNSDSGSDYGYTCADRRNLINAVIFDDLAKIKSFLEFPCELFENGCDDHFDVDGHDYFLYSPIYIACNLGKLSLLKLMALNKNINFDVKSGPCKSTPLMGAVQGGHYDVVYHLLTIHSIDINAVDSSGHKCIYYSLFRSKEINFKIVELLLNFGADVHSDGTGSISENLHSIPGNNNLHKKLIDNHKLQKGVLYKSNWSLLQNLHIFMSNKLYVKYNIKVDPSVLGPISTLPQTTTPVTTGMSSPEFLSPDRRIESPDDTDILELMGNFLGKLTEDVKEGINTTMDLLTEGLQHLHSSKTDFSTKNSGFSALNSGISLNSIKNMTSLKNTTSIRSFNSKTSINTLGTMGTIGNNLSNLGTMGSNLGNLDTLGSSNIKVVLNNIINEDTVQMSNLVMKYVEESLEIIRKTLYKMKTGLDETNPLMKSVWNELNLTLREFIIYHLCKFIKAIESETDEVLKNFIALANSFINQLSECEGLSIVSETQYIILRFIRFENQLVSFGIANNELLFTQRLRRNSQLLTNLHIIDSYSFDLGFYIYTSSHNALTDEINKLQFNNTHLNTDKLRPNTNTQVNTNTLKLNNLNGMEYSTMVGGNMYMFDRLRMELNNEMTFELDRTLVSLLDLLKNSENQLETLAKILIYSKNPDDMLVHLPPSDSQLWSPINITADTMFNNVQELRGKILKLKNTFPLSDMDLHLMYTVLWKLLNQYTSCEFVEDQKNNTEMKIINLLQGIGLINDMFQFGNYKMTHFDKITGIESKSFTSGENILRYNFMNSSSQNNEINLDGIGENLYIRPVSSPHLINRSDTNLSRNSGCSHLYLDLFNNNINRSDLTVNTTDAIVNGDLDENVLYESNNINTLENNRSNDINTFENINTTNNINTFENNRSNDLNTVLNRLNNESSKGLEANLGTNSGSNWNGRDLGSDYIFHSLSLILLADRIRYFEVISDVFRNVIPIISTILNQPLIQYRPINSLISQGFEDYYGIKQGENECSLYKDSLINIQNDIEGKRNVYEDWNMSCLSNNSMNKSFSVCMGPIMPIHFTDYLKNKPLVKRNVLNEMYEKIFTLGSLSVDRPYFSVRVDRGIAHTTKLLRNSLWFQSTAQILNCNPNILRAKNNQRPFMVVFKGEGSTDFGGPFQELLTCISNEFMFPLTPDNDSQSATIKCQNTINNYGMHQDTVLIKFSHYPVNNLFTQNSTLNDEKGLNENQNERVDKGNSIFTLGCCDLGVCCSSGCCCVLSTFPFDEPVGSKDIGSSCRCGASELYSDSCTQSVPMELSMYESLGRLCAMCLCMMNPLNIAINPIIWKKLLCSNLKLIDLLDCDKMSVDLLQRFASLESTGAVTEGDVNGLVFSIESAEGDTLDLVENGSNMPVSPSNLAKYLTLATLFRLTEGDLGCSFLAKGMNSVVPIGRLRTLLDPRSLEFVVCGDSLVDLAVLRAHTVSYSLNLKKDLFDVLSRFTNEMLQLFLRFVSGRSRLPHPNSDWCLRLEYDNKPDEDADKRLPTSATCSFRLLMPKYSSLDIMYKRLIYAIENCIAIDLDAHVVHDEMQLSIN